MTKDELRAKANELPLLPGVLSFSPPFKPDGSPVHAGVIRKGRRRERMRSFTLEALVSELTSK